MKVAQDLRPLGPPFNKFWIRHCKDFTYLITVSYCCCLPLNSVLHIHTFLSLPSPVSFKALHIQNFLSLPSSVSFEAVLHVNTLSLLSASVVLSKTLSPSNEEVCKHRFTTSATDARLLPLSSSVSFVTSSCRHHSLFVLWSYLPSLDELITKSTHVR